MRGKPAIEISNSLPEKVESGTITMFKKHLSRYYHSIDKPNAGIRDEERWANKLIGCGGLRSSFLRCTTLKILALGLSTSTRDQKNC